ncbi:Major facilitator superfamily domain general substrate transporter [Penicillium paradoxum]|uniref:Major facilitator superfamily domain general substrate transporter n=1 Tax=Penicillium paradoxum TaxID=176176 RepID=UPI0025467006|nr:Major facilitator superfamily domain general substrate transporter [Penicillium paradoxum]KAJ5773386.1 Major facilitator superfamily domain general substrate transporter [Penicillium paradoxum]
MSGSLHRTARIISVIAGTLVALSCGTNYAYSAWAPQFAQRMKLSSTETNLIGVAGNLGMYAMGIPMGLLTDARGPRLVALIGTVGLALGYFPIYMAYSNGQGSMPVAFLCLFAFLTGLGGCSAFGGAIKTAASNFPDHRGTATAFPMAAFGLSALFWSNVSTLIFKDNTGRFLLLLAIGTSTLTFASIPFLRILASEPYTSVPHNTHESRTRNSSDLEPIPEETDLRDSNTFEREHYPHARSHSVASNSQGRAYAHDDETATLVSKNDRPRPSFDTLDDDFLDEVAVESHQTDVRGLAMLRTVEFWQLFLTMGLLSGIGLMTINNIGNSVKALWLYYDDSATDLFIQHRQVMHVSILSFGNFVGRLFSGIGSDLLVKKLGMSRIWCLFLSAVVFTLTQLAGTTISNPNTLVVVSAFTGIAYGFLFGVFPSLTAHIFGINGLSQNWGVMTLAPVFSGNIFNLLYGNIYDGHSVVGPDGDRECPDGLGCYRTAYFMTFVSGIFGIAVCLWSILRERSVHNAMDKQMDHRLA